MNSHRHSAHRALQALAFGLVVGLGSPTFAQRTTIGPFVDFTGIVGVGLPTSYATQTQMDVAMNLWFVATADSNGGSSGVQVSSAPVLPITPCNPANGFPPVGNFCGSWSFTDSVTIGSEKDRAVKGVSFFSYDTSQEAGQVRITTLYGIDLNPAGNQLLIGGIEPSGPQMTFANERITGGGAIPQVNSAHFSERVRLSELSQVLGAGFDVSAIRGAPESTVQVFQTDVFVTSIASAVPEPSTYALFACGLVAVGLSKRRSLARAATRPHCS